MDIGHNKIEKLKENQLTNGQIRATVFNFTRPNLNSKEYKDLFFLAINMQNTLIRPLPNFYSRRVRNDEGRRQIINVHQP